MNGKILIDRKILDWEWWSDVNTSRVFIYLILMASWRDTRWHGKEIKRGTVITSLASMSAGTNLTPNEVRTAIKHLLSTGEITKQSTNKNTLIYVVNYDLYQSLSQTDNKQTTNESQTINKPLTTSEEDNKYKESKNIKNNNKYIVEIVGYLNEKTGKRYSASTKSTASSINARLEDGYTVDDFKTVIDVKVNEWKGTDYEKYLTPDTLFRPSKFEKYLNQKPQSTDWSKIV
jgi:uncharacterized phage protein (TIGR02220 family)